jgi:hypothetical protein
MKEVRQMLYINQYNEQQYLHGGIGYTDMEAILANEEYTAITIPCSKDFSVMAKMSRVAYLIKCLYKIPKGARLIFLYPAYAKLTRLLLFLLNKKGVKIVCVLMDINGLKDADKKQLKRDVNIFNDYQYFIVHNKKMQEWLNLQLPGKQSACLEFFDFLTKPSQKNRQLSYQIIFAGNLAKSSFLYQLHILNSRSPLLNFNLYGIGYDAQSNKQANVSWHGAAKPYELPEKMEGSFGLVWDGDSIDKPSGSLGDYMQYITHHKLSLYIVSGLPVIVPAFAASAYLVKKYRIGFVVNSLYEIQDKVASLTAAQYSEWCENTKPLADKITAGGCIKEALTELLPGI